MIHEKLTLPEIIRDPMNFSYMNARSSMRKPLSFRFFAKKYNHLTDLTHRVSIFTHVLNYNMCLKSLLAKNSLPKCKFHACIQNCYVVCDKKKLCMPILMSLRSSIYNNFSTSITPFRNPYSIRIYLWHFSFSCWCERQKSLQQEEIKNSNALKMCTPLVN